MKRITAFVLSGAAAVWLAASPSLRGEPKKPEVKVLSGRELFEHAWKARDPQSPAGDGLGPVHNANSCAACHLQGGIGGAGPSEANIDLVTPVIRPSRNGKDDRDRKKVEQLHAGFASAATTILLHKQGTSADYSTLRLTVLGVKVPPESDAAARARMWASLAKRQRTSPSIEEYEVSGVEFRLSHRSTPALFGAGLIDAIPDKVIQEQAELQAKLQTAKQSQISGRVARANGELANLFLPGNDPDNHAVSGVGRFGWRGQTSSLREFVLGACANELGLEVPNHSQPPDPFDAKYRSPGLDLDQNQCEKLIQFVRQLPRPVQVIPNSPDLAPRVAIGARAFRNIGCATCHVPDLGEVEGLYSDLLLHDMGPDLGDPIPANPAQMPAPHGPIPMGYFGGVGLARTVDIATPVHQEWRTTPLWGVADSAPYLHDGRAKTLEMAIAQHGGEAAESRDEFRRLSASEQQMLVLFLKTLRAPQVNPPRK